MHYSMMHETLDLYRDNGVYLASDYCSAYLANQCQCLQDVTVGGGKEC